MRLRAYCSYWQLISNIRAQIDEDEDKVSFSSFVQEAQELLGYIRKFEESDLNDGRIISIVSLHHFCCTCCRTQHS